MGIDIHIVAGPDGKSSSVEASGSVQHVITQDERYTFGLSEVGLKDAVNAYFGKTPNDAYLSSPTPWNDLYKTYNWPQVQTVLAVESAELLGITSNPVVVKTQEFTNSSSVKATFDVSISETVNNTATTTWSTSGTLKFEQSITVGIDFIIKGTATSTRSFTQSWGVGGTETDSITLGSTSGVKVELDPGESIIASLSASRGTMNVRVQYNSYLIGSTAVNYDPAYKDHHFWALPIGEVMKAGGLNNSVKSTADMEIGYYSNSKIELRDKDTGIMKATF